MKTGIIITGVAALASAAPAIPSAKGSSMQNATAMNPPVNGAQDGAWQVGCEKGNMDHENHQCSSFKGAAKGYTPSEYDAPAHPKYEPSTSQAAYSKPTAHGPPKYTSSHPAYEPSTTQAAYQKPTSYDSLKPSSTHAAYGKPPAYGPQKSSSTPADSKPTAHGPPEFTWAHPEYEPSSTTVNPYAKPSPSYGRRDGYGSPQHAPPAYTPEAPHGGKPTGSYGGKPAGTYGSKPEGSHGGKPEGLEGGKPEDSHGGKPQTPSSPPFCDFVESECIDCDEYPEDCDTCNFLFKCGEKKQCTYHGFRQTMTLCQEKGEECAWPPSDDEGEKEYDHPKGPGGPGDHPHGPGGKPEHPHGSGEKPKYTIPKPHGPPHGPESESHSHPHGPNGEKPKYSGPKPHGPSYGTNSTEHSHGPYSRPHGPHGEEKKSA